MPESPLRHLPIKWKLIAIITLVATVVSIAEISIFTYQDSANFRESRRSRAQITADIIGVNSSPALKFNDADDALEILRSLQSEDSIRSARLFTEGGEILAEYLKEGEPSIVPNVTLGKSSEYFTEESFSLTHPIIFNEKTIGTLHLLYDLRAFKERAEKRMFLGMIVGILSIAFSTILALWLQRIFVDPIRSLGETVDYVTETGDYSVRAPVKLRDEFGKVVDGFNHMLAEIGERDAKLAQQLKMLEESNRELDQRVEERTAELQSSNRELESFSYSVSHDLRAPLRAIQGFSQIMLEEYGPKLDEEGNRLLGIISSDVLKMGRLVDDLLAFSRMGRQQMTSGVVDMSELTRNVFEELKTSKPNQKAKLTMEDLPSASGDSSMLRQVIFNLLSNSFKFSSGREETEIKISAKEDEGQNIYTFEDNGVGFDIRFKNKLFGVFQRLHSEEEFEGTGVGLAIVQRVIHRHGGTIDAESVLGQGAKFIFSLPKVPADSAKANIQEAANN